MKSKQNIKNNDINPVSWTQKKWGFYMFKSSYKDKINKSLFAQVAYLSSFLNISNYNFHY